ncbi:hypothetical protein GGR56DRAFT_506345 [Xylariaceae sp. FL0804]|nr:hypothetical protein GGR56DRAFT_506345 [Xylariaceae sp. FL0804]
MGSHWFCRLSILYHTVTGGNYPTQPSSRPLWWPHQQIADPLVSGDFVLHSEKALGVRYRYSLPRHARTRAGSEQDTDSSQDPIRLTVDSGASGAVASAPTRPRTLVRVYGSGAGPATSPAGVDLVGPRRGAAARRLGAWGGSGRRGRAALLTEQEGPLLGRARKHFAAPWGEEELVGRPQRGFGLIPLSFTAVIPVRRRVKILVKLAISIRGRTG